MVGIATPGQANATAGPERAPRTGLTVTVPGPASPSVPSVDPSAAALNRSAPLPLDLVRQSAAVEQLDRVIVSLLHERMVADARIQAMRTESHLGQRTLSEEKELLERYAGPLGRLGTRIAMLILTQ